jgi:hypothetical protein
MPKNPTVEQGIEWHINHTKNCKCMPIPTKIQALIDEKKENKVRSK